MPLRCFPFHAANIGQSLSRGVFTFAYVRPVFLVGKYEYWRISSLNVALQGRITESPLFFNRGWTHIKDVIRRDEKLVSDRRVYGYRMANIFYGQRSNYVDIYSAGWHAAEIKGMAAVVIPWASVYHLNPRTILLLSGADRGLRLLLARFDGRPGFFDRLVHLFRQPIHVSDDSVGLIGSVSPIVPHLIQLTLHDGELALVNDKRRDANDGKNQLSKRVSFFQPVKFFGKLLYFGVLLLGITLAAIGHFALLFGDRVGWGFRRVLCVGVTGWILAVILIWHGASVLLLGS